MARRRGERRFSKSKGALIWTTIINDDVNIAIGATKTGTDIVTDSDWTAVGGQERATIMRIRGWFGASQEPVAVLTGAGAMFGYVGIYDEDELSAPADVATTYSEEDIMATYGHVFPFSDIGQTAPAAWQETVDIKAMRKIRRGQDCRFVLTNRTSTIVATSFVIRALVKRS